jgi:hypothetical protein
VTQPAGGTVNQTDVDLHANAKLSEFRELSYGDSDPTIRKFVADEKLATMQGQDVPAQGAVEKCADAISASAR